MPNVMAALPNIGGALCSMPQSLVFQRGVTDGVRVVTVRFDVILLQFRRKWFQLMS